MRISPFIPVGTTGQLTEFMMEYPCVIGYRGRDVNQRVKYQWLRMDQHGFHFCFDRKRAHAVPGREQLNKLLQCLTLLGETEGVFIEPLEVKS